VWEVMLEVRIQERHNVTALLIKDATIKVPLRIIRADIDRERNPWGMLIDGGDELADRITLNDPTNSRNGSNHY